MHKQIIFINFQVPKVKSHSLMALIARLLVRVFLQMLLLGTFVSGQADHISDINCLKSISESLEDPYDNLKSWNFSSSSICNFLGVVCWNEFQNDVFSLDLSYLGLKGKFPRGVGNCTRLTALDLSNNNLSGHLPSDIEEILQFVTFLDLSSNNFSGEIPPGIADCVYLNGLRLENNQLTGQIPWQLGRLTRIKTFSVAHNLLSGPVPDFVNLNVTSDCYKNNTGLCGAPLKPCKELQVWKIFPETESPFRYAFGVGFEFSVLSVLVFLFSYSAGLVYFKRKGSKEREYVAYSKLTNVKHLQQASNKIPVLESLVTRMNFEELSIAANNFSKNNIIGMGKMGAVYKATVSNGNWFLAIKRIPNSQNFDHEFFSEVMALGRLKHPNIVRLLGFSSKGKEKLLVYKYEPNGSLYERLHSMKGETQTMEWPVRVKIAVGLARGLAWLHHNHYLPTAHLNVSSKCILLNPKFEPKLSDFTGAIFFNASNTKVAKSKTCELGHMKKDVYSFGVVLLELITGKKPSEMNDSRNPERTSDVCYGLDEVVDKSLIWKEFDGEIIQLLRIACDCVQPLPDERPTMVEVYKTLRAMGEKYGLSDDSQTSTLLIFEMDPWRSEVK